MPVTKNEKCNACGSYDFSINDGFKYCDRCGALLENFEELEEEEAGTTQKLVGSGKIKVKRNDGENRIKREAPIMVTATQVMAEAVEKRSDFLKRQIVRGEELPIPHDSTPDYLFRLALRIFSFTQVLSKAGFILVKELHFDPRLQNVILATFQRYLLHCKVAFCHSEQCGSDERLRFVAIMENIYYDEQKREEKRRNKLARRGKGAKALSRSAAAWTLLTQGNITENLDLDSDTEDDIVEDFNDVSKNFGNSINSSMEKMEVTQDTVNDEETMAVNDTTLGFVRKVTTALSKDALLRASQFVLSLELFVAVLHSAIMCTGYKNILVSDITRWVREDRFRISKRAIRLFRPSQPELIKREEADKPNAFPFLEPYMRFPLYEIVRTCTVFHQSLNLERNMVSQEFDALAARLIDNLNLPIDFLSRVLILESIVPCDMSPFLLKQVDVRLGYNFEQLSVLEPETMYDAFLSSFGRKERRREKDACNDVLISADTKLVAYILLAFRLTFDLDNAVSLSSRKIDVLGTDQFDVDTWIHQLEMRIKCWQGHDMTMVLRSTCPVPNMTINASFGPNYTCYDNKETPFVHRRTREAGFQNCIPPELSFNSTSTLPTVFDIRSNRYSSERCETEAVLAPLKFQRFVLRREKESNTKAFENTDPHSERTFFKDFTTDNITGVSESFDDQFPLAKRYSVYKRPDWLQNCTARKSQSGSKTGPFRFYLSNQVCEDLLGVAAPSFSHRFKFLLESLSLLIGEDQKAVYAAFVMLEMHLTSPERLEFLRRDLLTASPIPIQCQKFRNSTYHVPCKRKILAEQAIDRMEDLKYFIVASIKDDEEGIRSSENQHLVDLRNDKIREDLAEREKTQKTIMKLCYDFETFFSILALKFW
ncbi:hypothetical protein CAEBREN_10044 [Caenorhabditis brenneri]|uniref:TATA box-binding protein-associated factor RNA polymerase I subunit B n=1 Tax=Caenorhabditis brenneri TaxID=135651 RepID=G0MYT9_CAEBE|nr:hypothetical protein CAEBREN_10044 [Caenorhabditis brenneri]